MKDRLIHIMFNLCFALAAMLVQSCSSSYSEPAPASTRTSLGVRVSMVGARATEEAGIERVMQMRIIILRADGRVEVNRFVDFSNTTVEDYHGLFTLIPNENKTIYAIANPESTAFPFADYPEGSYGLGDALENYAFEFNASKPLVLTDSRIIPASQLKIDKRSEIELNLVRIATKFTVDITNSRLDQVTVKEFSVSLLNDGAQYLLPHFTGTADRHIVNNSGLLGFDFDSQTGLHWSDWMKLTVDESQASPEDTDLADRRGWIMMYDVPPTAQHSNHTFTLPSNPVIVPDGKLQFATQYFAESRSGLRSNSTFGNGAASGSEQSYNFTLKVSSTEGGNKTFNEVKLPNLRALFRNTHVVVHLNLFQDRVQCEVRVVPYVVVDLKPEFGWGHLPDEDEDPDSTVPGVRPLPGIVI